MRHCTDLLPRNGGVTPLPHVLMGSFPPCKKRAPAPSQEQYEDRNFSVGAGDILSEAFPFAGRCDGGGGF